MKWLLRFVPLAALFATAVGLHLYWDRIPEVWPIHWGWRGEPDGFAHRTLLGVYLPLALGLVMWAAMEGAAAFSERRRQLPFEVREAIGNFIRLIALAVTTTFCLLAVWLPFSGEGHPRQVMWLSLLLLFASVLGGGMRLSSALQRARAQGAPGLEGYSAFRYRNPEDPRIWVPKLSGLGSTLNFAHWQAWLILGLLLLPIALAMGLLLLQRG